MGARKGADEQQTTGSAVREPCTILTKWVTGKWRGNTGHEERGARTVAEKAIHTGVSLKCPVPSSSANPRVVHRVAGRETGRAPQRRLLVDHQAPCAYPNNRLTSP